MKDNKDKKKYEVKRLRMIIMAGVLLLFTIGIVLKTGFGTISSFGIGAFSMICPVGFLETALAARTILPRALIAFLVIILLTVLLGRVFCGWACPVPLVRKVVTNKEEPKKKKADPHKNGIPSLIVLGAALVASFIFRFPVFCLFCPVGLVFSSIYAIVRLFAFSELVLDILVFPVILILEFVLFRRWCSTLCPIGALLSLFSRLNKRFVPTVDNTLCLDKKDNANCDICRSVCTLDIDLKEGKGASHISQCTKCRECAVHCPAQAIRLPWKRKTSSDKAEKHQS